VIPIAGGDGRHVAIGLFLSELFKGGDQGNRAARVLGWTTTEFDAWTGDQTPGRPSRFLSLAEAISSRLAAEIRVQEITAEDRETTRLTEAEYGHIKMHTEIGYKIPCDLRQLGEVLPVVRHHHEAWDGTGCPVGLAGEQIPKLARIVAVADAFDAMSSDRSYRRGMADERLDEILRKGSRTQWDPEVIASFYRIREELRQMIKGEPTAEPVDEEVRLLT
jgi:hypothetical protein